MIQKNDIHFGTRILYDGNYYIVRVIEGNKAVAFPLDAHQITLAFHTKTKKVISRTRKGNVEIAPAA